MRIHQNGFNVQRFKPLWQVVWRNRVQLTPLELRYASFEERLHSLRHIFTGHQRNEIGQQAADGHDFALRPSQPGRIAKPPSY